MAHVVVLAVAVARACWLWLLHKHFIGGVPPPSLELSGNTVASLPALRVRTGSDQGQITVKSDICIAWVVSRHSLFVDVQIRACLAIHGAENDPNQIRESDPKLMPHLAV